MANLLPFVTFNLAHTMSHRLDCVFLNKWIFIKIEIETNFAEQIQKTLETKALKLFGTVDIETEQNK